jgi:RNA polymerase sigma-70 factor (ECF subfamily)
MVSPTAPPDIVLELRGVYKILDKLPADDRVILILRRVEELTLEEIAERTGWSLATVKRRLARAELALAKSTAEPGDA